MLSRFLDCIYHICDVVFLQYIHKKKRILNNNLIKNFLFVYILISGQYSYKRILNNIKVVYMQLCLVSGYFKVTTKTPKSYITSH